MACSIIHDGLDSDASTERHSITTSNFTKDVTTNGNIDGADESLVSSKSGTSLP
jgi:hypothetical protein